MGRFSEVVFGRRQLPSKCVVYGGAYVPWTREVVRRLLPGGTRLTGHWVRYSYARAGRHDILVLFNVYGAAVTLEVLRLLQDGGTREAFFVGSMYARDLPVGTLVLPTKAIDQAGVVALDDPRETGVPASPTALDRLRKALKRANLSYEEREVVSVPSVLHDIGRVNDLLDEKGGTGVEMEVSTFYYFARKLGLRGYALLYVSDNDTHDVISRADIVRRAKRQGMREATQVAARILGG